MLEWYIWPLLRSQSGTWPEAESLLFLAACNISMYYYAGFCYLLLRRYTDAARTFNIVLNYISRFAAVQRCS
jgi:hypothetical protein